MLVVGVIEIIADIGVALKRLIFTYVVAPWLVVIIANLLLIPGYFDIALRLRFVSRCAGSRAAEPAIRPG
jgi:hypothetical protein